MSPVISKGVFKKGLIVGALAVSFFTVPSLAATQGVVRGTNVNIRTSNSKGSPVHSQMNEGDTVQLAELAGDYYRILDDGAELYISKDFVSVGKSSGKINSSSVNIRKFPSTNHDVLSQADAGESFEVLGKSGDWINILYESESAFVHKDFIDVPFEDSLETVTVVEPDYADDIGLVAALPLADEFYAVVNTSAGLRLREFPSTESPVLTAYSEGTTVDIMADYGDWIKTSLDGIEGYMSREFVAIKEGKRPENSRGSKIIDYAKRYIGTPYVWGGTSLARGVDCSGFVFSVMKEFGITLNRNSRGQYKNGYSVSKGDLRVGDLVFFDTDRGGYISHVGIYIGGGQFIHSSSSKRTWGVTISSLYEDYYSRTYYSACRIL